MSEKEKKMAAVLSAVGLYLEQEQAQVAEQKGGLEDQEIPGPTQWVHSGRQEMMMMRRLTELRTFRRI